MVALGEVILEARGIHKLFGQNHVLRGVELAVRRHETVVLIGRSGGGKTTLLRCLNLLEQPTLGRIRIDDVEVEADPLREAGRGRAEAARRLRLKAGMVFQEFNLFPHMTVLENCIEAPISVKNVPRADAIVTAERYLEKVHLIDKRDEYPARMSSGQKQRAAIARALCMGPEVMLFDEPTSALDPELVGEVLTVIRDLAAEGRTMLLVTHEMKFAREVATHVVYLFEGRIEEEGPPDELFGNPKSARLQQFLATVG